jgi:DNA-binding winged helix-turn-helix (wHTH) protein/tetratricopeptide (TPR) repeat protein
MRVGGMQARLLQKQLSFGPFVFETKSGKLTKSGYRIKLQPKSASVLKCLLDHQGEIVTRNELRNVLWPDGTYVDFDSGIKVAVKKLRDALGDSSENPTYVQTFPGEGYRFIASATEVPLLAVTRDEAPSPVRAIPERGSRANAFTGLCDIFTVWVRSHRLTSAGILAAIIVLGVSFQLLTKGQRIAPQFQSVALVVTATPNQDLQSDILAEAAAESVIHGLRRASNLKVIVEHALVPPDQVLSLGRTINCDGILLLETERTGDRFVVRVATINAAKGDRVWQETVTGRVSDAGWLSTNVREVVLRHFAIHHELLDQEKVSSVAFQEYVRGRYFWSKRTPENLDQAFASFRAAIKDDPDFAMAYAGLAQTYAVADIHDSRYHARDETYREARLAAEHAIAIDPTLASAHAALAQILRNHDRNMAAAEREYLKAIELDESDATAHQWYAEFLSINGRHDEAIAQIDRAHELDPLSAVVTAVSGDVRINARRYAEALPFIEDALRLDPHYYNVYNILYQAMWGLKRYPEAVDAFVKQAEASGDASAGLAARQEKAAFVRGGVQAMWRERLRRILKQQDSPDQAYNLALIYCHLDEVEPCLSSLEKAVTEHGETVTSTKIDPAFDIIREDPRYDAMVRRFGFSSDPASLSPAHAQLR